jgi:hypothetical protein
MVCQNVIHRDEDEVTVATLSGFLYIEYLPTEDEQEMRCMRDEMKQCVHL